MCKGVIGGDLCGVLSKSLMDSNNGAGLCVPISWNDGIEYYVICVLIDSYCSILLYDMIVT